jgi:hypothetical protein
MVDSIDLIDKSNPMSQPITFITTPGEDIAGHICGNARCRNDDCGIVMPCKCDPPNRVPMVQMNQYKGLTLVIAGAGPSLSKAYKQIKKADHVWGCNSATNWLVDQKWKCTHGIAIDASPRMFGEVWIEPHPMEYLLATTVNPLLTDHILAHDHSVEFFHSARSTLNEELLCNVLYPDAPICKSGLNVANRAIELAVWMGYRKIYMAGCDNAMTESGIMYTDGRGPHAMDAIIDGTIDGRKWKTKPDMLLSACSMAQAKWSLGSRLEFIGNVLPATLARKDQAFMDRCILWGQQSEDLTGTEQSAKIEAYPGSEDPAEAEGV